MERAVVGDRRAKFVVLTTQRSGSTWLISILHKLEGATVYGELFLQRTRAPGEKKWDSDFAYPRFFETKPKGIRPFSVFSYLNVLYRTPGAVGFKLMYSQLKPYPEVLAYMIMRRIRVVHLFRRNDLDVVISRAIKASIGHAHVLSGQPAPDPVRVRLDCGALVTRLRHLQSNRETMRRFLRWSGQPHVEVAYEDIVGDASHFRRIGEFLSIDPGGQVPDSNLVKIRKGGHADVLSNYHEVKAALAGSVFAPLLQ